MAAPLIDIVGGPADGGKTLRPSAPAVVVPVATGGGVFGQYQYTLRRCTDVNGNVVEVLAPAGRPVDPAFLSARRLKN